MSTLTHCWSQANIDAGTCAHTAAVTEEKAPPAKKQKRAIEDDLICPISLELPFEPVIAEDGR